MCDTTTYSVVIVENRKNINIVVWTFFFFGRVNEQWRDSLLREKDLRKKYIVGFLNGRKVIVG